MATKPKPAPVDELPDPAQEPEPTPEPEPPPRPANPLDDPAHPLHHLRNA